LKQRAAMAGPLRKVAPAGSKSGVPTSSTYPRTASFRASFHKFRYTNRACPLCALAGRSPALARFSKTDIPSARYSTVRGSPLFVLPTLARASRNATALHLSPRASESRSPYRAQASGRHIVPRRKPLRRPASAMPRPLKEVRPHVPLRALSNDAGRELPATIEG
jgi:hypothetical protein